MFRKNRQSQLEEEKKAKALVDEFNRDNWPYLPEFGADYPLTTKIQCRAAHYIFYPPILNAAAVSLAERRFGNNSEDIYFNGVLDFALESLVKPNGTSFELNKEQKKEMERLDPKGFFFLEEENKKEKTEVWRYNGYWFTDHPMKKIVADRRSELGLPEEKGKDGKPFPVEDPSLFDMKPFVGRKYPKYSIVVETLLKESAIPLEVRERMHLVPTECDPLIFENPADDTTNIDSLFDVTTSVAGYLITILIYDRHYSLDHAFVSQLRENYEKKNIHLASQSQKDGLATCFDPPSLENEVGTGGMVIDQNTGQPDPTSLISEAGDPRNAAKIRSNLVNSGGLEKGSTNAPPVFLNSSTNMHTESQIKEFFSEYRKRVVGVKSSSYKVPLHAAIAQSTFNRKKNISQTNISQTNTDSIDVDKPPKSSSSSSSHDQPKRKSNFSTPGFVADSIMSTPPVKVLFDKMAKQKVDEESHDPASNDDDNNDNNDTHTLPIVPPKLRHRAFIDDEAEEAEETEEQLERREEITEGDPDFIADEETDESEDDDGYGSGELDDDEERDAVDLEDLERLQDEQDEQQEEEQRRIDSSRHIDHMSIEDHGYKPVSSLLTSDVPIDLNVSLIKREELVPVLKRFNVWSAQCVDRIVDATLTGTKYLYIFKAPVPGCTYAVETPFPKMVKQMIFPQTAIHRHCLKVGIVPTYAQLYRAKELMTKSNIAALTKPDTFITSGGIASAFLQPHEEIGERTRPQQMEISMSARHKINEQKTADLRNKHYIRCMSEMRIKMEGPSDASKAMKAIYSYTSPKNKKDKPMCRTLPHFHGFAPGSDMRLTDLFLINETVGLELGIYAETILTSCMGIWNMSLQRKRSSFPTHTMMSAMAGVGKSTLIKRFLESVLIYFTWVKWGSSTEKSMYQITKAQNFIIQLSEEIPENVIGRGVMTNDTETMWKGVLGDQTTTLSRTIVTKSDYYTRLITIMTALLYIGCINSTCSPHFNRTNPLNNRWLPVVVGTSFIADDKNHKTESTRANDPVSVANQARTSENFQDFQACVAWVIWMICMGILQGPSRDFLDMLIYRMRETKGLYNTKSLRHLGRMVYTYDTLTIKTAVHVLFRSWGSPLLTWKKANIIDRDTKEKREGLAPQSPLWNNDLLVHVQNYMMPSWDNVLSSWATVYGHDRAIAHRFIQKMLTNFGLNLGLIREYNRYYDQTLSWVRLNIDGPKIFGLDHESRELALEQIRHPSVRSLLTEYPLYKSMLYWGSEHAEEKMSWKASNPVRDRKIEEFMKNIEKLKEQELETVTKSVPALLNESSKAMEFEKPKISKKNKGKSAESEPSSSGESSSAFGGFAKSVFAKPAPVTGNAGSENKGPTTKSEIWEAISKSLHLEMMGCQVNNADAFSKLDKETKEKIKKTAYSDYDMNNDGDVKELKALFDIKLCDMPTEILTCFKPRNTKKVSLGYYDLLKYGGAPALPFAIVGICPVTGERLVNLNYLQIVPDRNRDWIFDFIREMNGMSDSDKTPEAPYFMNIAYDMKQIMPYLDESIPMSKAPQNGIELARLLSAIHLRTREKRLISVLMNVNAPQGSTSREESQNGQAAPANIFSSRAQQGSDNKCRIQPVKANKVTMIAPTYTDEEGNVMDIDGAGDNDFHDDNDDPPKTKKSSSNNGKDSSKGKGIQPKIGFINKPASNISMDGLSDSAFASGPKAQEQATGSVPDGNNNNSPAFMKLIHVSLLWLMMDTESMVEHELSSLTSEHTKPGRKVALPIPSTRDNNVPMVITVPRGTASSKFANFDHVSHESEEALRSIYVSTHAKPATRRERKTSPSANTDETTAEDDEKYKNLFEKLSAESHSYLFNDRSGPVRQLPDDDEEIYFCDDYAKKIGLDEGKEECYPTAVRDYIESMKEKGGMDPLIFKSPASCNSSKREVHDEFRRF